MLNSEVRQTDAHLTPYDSQPTILDIHNGQLLTTGILSKTLEWKTNSLGSLKPVDDKAIVSHLVASIATNGPEEGPASHRATRAAAEQGVQLTKEYGKTLVVDCSDCLQDLDLSQDFWTLANELAGRVLQRIHESFSQHRVDLSWYLPLSNSLPLGRNQHLDSVTPQIAEEVAKFYKLARAITLMEKHGGDNEDGYGPYGRTIVAPEALFYLLSLQAANDEFPEIGDELKKLHVDAVDEHRIFSSHAYTWQTVTGGALSDRSPYAQVQRIRSSNSFGEL